LPAVAAWRIQRGPSFATQSFADCTLRLAVLYASRGGAVVQSANFYNLYNLYAPGPSPVSALECVWGGNSAPCSGGGPCICANLHGAIRSLSYAASTQGRRHPWGRWRRRSLSLCIRAKGHALRSRPCRTLAFTGQGPCLRAKGHARRCSVQWRPYGDSGLRWDERAKGHVSGQGPRLRAKGHAYGPRATLYARVFVARLRLRAKGHVSGQGPRLRAKGHAVRSRPCCTPASLSLVLQGSSPVGSCSLYATRGGVRRESY
jgi:hypothetical protein